MSKRLVAGIAAAALGLGTLSAGAVLAPAILAGPAQAAGQAPITLNSTTSPIPDAVALPNSGTWTRTAEGAYTAVVPPGENGAAMSEQLVSGTARYTAEVSVDPETPYGVGTLLFRAAADGSGGYAVALDPNLDRVRLFDLATGEDVVPSAAVPLDTGHQYSVDVHVDGPRIYVEVDGIERLDAVDQRYQSGHLGLLAYNGRIHFGQLSARSVEANVTGWTTSGAGWQASATGLRGTAATGANLRAVATGQIPQVTDFTADVQIHSAYAVGAVLFRSNAAGSAGYAAEVDPNAGRLRLYRIEDNTTLGTYNTAITVNGVYRLRVTADGGQLAVHWQTDFLDPDGYAPVITAQDAAHGSGHVGLRSFNGDSAFQGLTLKGLESSLQGWRSASGSWEPDVRGLRGAADGMPVGGEASRFIPAVASDVVVSLDLDVAAPATAAVVVRCNEDGSGGTELRIDPGAGTVVLRDRAAGTDLANSAVPPDSLAVGQLNRVQLTVRGTQATALINGIQALSGPAGTASGKGFGLLVSGGGAHFQNVRADDVAIYMNGLYQPGYHYSQNSGNSSDPNGLVYLDGEYHLFHQDRGRWAHAVSTDLLHWKQLPIALPHLAAGESWSGSAVVDATDASGLFGGGRGLVAFYTSFNHDAPNGNQSVRAAYSADHGRTWQLAQAPPVVENPGGPSGAWDFRDPKITWDAAAGTWIMVVAAGDHLRFYTSTNLLQWSFASTFGYGNWVRGGVLECPDFFELPVEGQPGVKRWVLWWSTGAVRSTNGSAAQYVTGTWNGTAFSPDSGPEQLLQADAGRDYYAAMSFFGAPDGRRIMLGWMSNWDYAFSAPTGRWNGQLSVPREMSLKEVPGAGLRLAQEPVRELASLRNSTWQATEVLVGPDSANPLAAVTGRSFELEAEVAIPSPGGASAFSFGLRKGSAGGASQETLVRYDGVAGTLGVDRSRSGREDFTRYFAGDPSDNSSTPWSSSTVAAAGGGTERRINVRVLVDASSVELFGGDGTAAITSLIFPGPDSTGLSFSAEGGNVRLVTVKVHQLADTSRLTSAPPSAVLPPETGTARHNLGAYAVVPGGRWESSGAGLAGSFDKDSTALSAGTYANVKVEATVRFGGGPYAGAMLNGDLAADRGYGGAGSVLLRASADGSTAYYVNLDPNLRLARIFKLENGSFNPATSILASVPLLLSHAVSYRLEAQADGDRLTVTLDGTKLIDVQDPGPASGRVGLNVFDGRAAYQDVRVTALS
ncbi:glycoside hydrolase family 32 protein [Arthrobacter sp. ISL-48]|uniref:glycoside hydrolase family 32 protein n=1 Tax=Arthrobacter sp. ISL-48 TaxID=2819110 RepID=UPI001BE4FC35|nr:glycoside hydrolase family 32 protein [Arthrobacter sp. ISL-48]MBT2531115.1 glycoside hydrolase family 32 protein [Arthrobacter sp. ISL-48]